MFLPTIVSTCTKCNIVAKFGRRGFVLKLKRTENGYFSTKRQFSTSRLNLCEKTKANDGKAVTKSDGKAVTKSESKAVPKYTDVRRLLSLAHAERWKIGGKYCFYG